MDYMDAFFAFLKLYGDKLPAGAGTTTACVGAALLSITIFMKFGKYHLDKATTLSQIGATAVTSLQGSMKLAQEELAATRTALADANRQLLELREKVNAALEAAIAAERAAASMERERGNAEEKLQAALSTIAELRSGLAEANLLIARLQRTIARLRGFLPPGVEAE